MKAIKDLKHGEYFTLREIEEPKESQVWIRDDYDPAEKEYICYNFADTSKWKYLKGDKKVYDSEHRAEPKGARLSGHAHESRQVKRHWWLFCFPMLHFFWKMVHFNCIANDLFAYVREF